jgi:hypothetical protein
MLGVLGHQLLLSLKLLGCSLLLLHVHLLLLHGHTVSISTRRERAGRWLPRHDAETLVKN